MDGRGERSPVHTYPLFIVFGFVFVYNTHMKEQLPKPLQFVYPIPDIVIVLTTIVSAFFMLVTVDGENRLSFYGVVLVFILSIVAIIGKNMATSKLKKIRNGVNPLYLITKHKMDLDGQIKDLLDQGYEIKEATSKTAHMERKAPFSVISLIVWTLLGVLPGIIYVIWYTFQPKEVVLLNIETQK